MCFNTNLKQTPDKDAPLCLGRRRHLGGRLSCGLPGHDSSLSAYPKQLAGSPGPGLRVLGRRHPEHRHRRYERPCRPYAHRRSHKYAEGRPNGALAQDGHSLSPIIGSFCHGQGYSEMHTLRRQRSWRSPVVYLGLS